MKTLFSKWSWITRVTVADFLVDKDRANGDAIAEGLGERHDVGRDANPLVGPELAGATESALAKSIVLKK